MAGQTIRTKQWGWNVGGVGTDATTVTSGQTYVKGVLLAANASADTVLLTDGAGVTLINWAAPVTKTEYIPVEAKIKGLILTMSASTDRASIFVT